MDNKIIATLAGAAVVVVMLGSLLVPIIYDAIDDTKVYYNNDYGAFADVSDNEVINLELTTVMGTPGSSTYYINGEELGLTQGNRVIIVSENLIVVFENLNGIGIAGVDVSGNLIRTWADSVTVAINGESITIEWAKSDNNTSGTINVKSSWMFYRTFEGDWRAVDYVSGSKTAYINDLSQVYSSNWSGPIQKFFSLNGTSVNVYSGTIGGAATLSTTTATVEVTEVMNGVSSFVISSDHETSGVFKFTADNAGEPYDVFPYYFIIPVSVYGQTESNIAVVGILTVLPMLIVVAVLVSFVYYGSRY